MKNHLLILSAELISKEMQKIFGEIPPILLPYGEKTVLTGTYEANKKRFEIEVISSKESQLIEKSIKDQNMDMKLTVINKLDKIENSILASKVENQNNLTIVFGDTTLKNWSFKDYIGDKVAYVEVSDPLSWTTFEVEKELRIYDKVRREFKEKYQSFAGIFSFSNPKLFFEILEKNKNFYETILAYDKVHQLDFVFEPNWVDLGHQEEFNKNNEVQARYFNEITVNREKGILTKKSTEVKKYDIIIKARLDYPPLKKIDKKILENLKEDEINIAIGGADPTDITFFGKSYEMKKVLELWKIIKYNNDLSPFSVNKKKILSDSHRLLDMHIRNNNLLYNTSKIIGTKNSSKIIFKNFKKELKHDLNKFNEREKEKYMNFFKTFFKYFEYE